MNPTDHDHQVAIFLFTLAGIVVALVAAVLAVAALVWVYRRLDVWAARRYQEARDGAAQRAPRPEYEATAHRWHGTPPVMAWTDEIETQCKSWTEADDRDIAAYLSDMPYDHEKEGGL